MTEKNSFWSTMPGILAGIAGIITAIGGLFLALNQAGILGQDDVVPESTNTEQVVTVVESELNESRLDTLSLICPVGYKGCSKHNLCSSCFETCGYCQNLDDSYCGAEDCMTCKEGYELLVVYGDGTGRCVPDG